VPPEAWDALRERVARLPQEPGVYVWKDAAGRALYVGKAENLRSRVRAYLKDGGDGRPLVRLLMRRVADVDVVLCGSAPEALLLENTLIKQERPPYNLRLKDDKAYLLVRVDRDHPFPRLRLVRKVKQDGALYLGPFASAKAVRRTLRFLRTRFPLRTCSDGELAERERACLYHQIGRCAAPCIQAIDETAYGALVDGAVAVLRGRDAGLVDRLREEMHAASETLEYERAALLRDRVEALEGAVARQEVVSPDGKDRDVVAVALAGGVAIIAVLYVRDGHLMAARTWAQKGARTRRELVTAFLEQFYLRGKVVPPEVLVEEAPEDVPGIEALLGGLRGAPVHVRQPQRGAGAELLGLARRNAEQALTEHSARARDAQAALQRLADLLGLDEAPQRIEGYDLSHLGGSEPVAAMSVLVAGVPDPSAYRHFALREAPGGDDYAGMAEVIRRRFARGESLGDLPDLILIDGGRGQVEAALRALAELGHPAIPMLGLAKARVGGGPGGSDAPERLVLPPPARSEAGAAWGLHVPAEDDPALRLLVKVRDEAHRFAGRYQRKRRAEAFGAGALDGIPGLGPARKRALLTRFGSVAGVRAARAEDLAALPGIGERLARAIRERLEATGRE
jgi:excinuclease ABC subunit C